MLRQHPAVIDAAVVGRRDDVAGDLPTAFVVGRINLDSAAVNVSEQEIIDFVAGSFRFFL